MGTTSTTSTMEIVIRFKNFRYAEDFVTDVDYYYYSSIFSYYYSDYTIILWLNNDENRHIFSTGNKSTTIDTKFKYY